MAVTGSARLGEESYIEFRERDAIEVETVPVRCHGEIIGPMKCAIERLPFGFC
uniref:Uncharacterized protein n=2 Tax=Oryza TaxID=4527 RepID=Q10ED7_ORYSJ|nr:hypothetical protein LOC_Os03g56080 [Oryza sativa Japonica Group]